MTDENIQRPASFDDLQIGMALQGTVKRVELYGAFVDLGIGLDGLLHISQLGKPNVRNVTDVVNVGDSIVVYVLRIDRSTRKVALSMERPAAVSWDNLRVGEVVKGKVVKIENFGVFVDIGAERQAMIHVSELAAGFVKSPADVVKVGDEVTAQIIKVDPKKRRIDLSIKALDQAAEKESMRAAREEVQAEEDSTPMPTAFELALKRAMAESGEQIPETSSGKGGKRDDRRNNKRDRREREQQDLEDIFERTLRNNR